MHFFILKNIILGIDIYFYQCYNSIMNVKSKKKIYPYVGRLTDNDSPECPKISFEHASPWKTSDVSFYWMNFEYPLLHTHTDWELFIILNDHMLHRINGQDKILTVGTACLVGPKDTHAMFYPNRIKNQFQGVCFPVRDGYFKNLLSLYSPTLYDELSSTPEPLYFTLSPNSLEHYSNQLLEIQTFENQNTPYTELQCNVIFSEILLKFISQRLSDSSIPPVLKPLIVQLNNPLITTEQIKAAQQELPYSYPQLTRIFKKYMRCTITQYVNRAKLQYAKELLAYTDMSLMEITNELNFESTSHFHNLFKKHFNITPAEFRKSNKSLSENKSSNK